MDNFVRAGNAKHNKAALKGGVENRDFSVINTNYLLTTSEGSNFNFCQISLEIKVKVEEEIFCMPSRKIKILQRSASPKTPNKHTSRLKKKYIYILAP